MGLYIKGNDCFKKACILTSNGIVIKFAIYTYIQFEVSYTYKRR